MNFTRLHRKVTPSFFSGSSSEASSSQTSLHALDTPSSLNTRTTTSSIPSPAESSGDPSSVVRPKFSFLFEDSLLISVDRPILSVALSWTPNY